MRKMNKTAFTLVELIVVITILAILATVAFISFGGQTSKAKNAKITSDLSSLASKVNVMTLNAGKTVTDFQSNTGSINKLTSGTGAGLPLTYTDSKYWVGKINFYELQQKEKDFQDTSVEPPRDYIYGSIAKDTIAVFNVAGQTTDEAWVSKLVIKGSYYEATSDWSDVDSLISTSTANTVAVNWETGTLY